MYQSFRGKHQILKQARRSWKGMPQKANTQKVSEYVVPSPGWITRNYTAQRCDDMTTSQVSLTEVLLRLYRTYILSPHRGFHCVPRSEGPGPSLPFRNLALCVISGSRTIRHVCTRHDRRTEQLVSSSADSLKLLCYVYLPITATYPGL